MVSAPGAASPAASVGMLGNLATTPQTLTNWRLLDKNGRVTPIHATLAPGASLILELDGAGVQLGNNGGNLILRDDTSAQVDVVTYTAEDAASDNRYVRFRRSRLLFSLSPPETPRVLCDNWNGFRRR